jgi:hypothetical protein
MAITVKNCSTVSNKILHLDILMINLIPNFISVCATTAKKINRKWVDRQTDRPSDSSKAMCPPFFEGGRN